MQSCPLGSLSSVSATKRAQCTMVGHRDVQQVVHLARQRSAADDFGPRLRRGAEGVHRIALVAADLSKPDVIRDTMAFMFETRHVLHPTRHALASAQRQPEYQRCWQGLKKHFDPERP